MKYARFGLILVGVIVVFSGCEKPGEPDPPTLIAPANDAVFDTLPPAFVWNSDEFADGYQIIIDDDSITSVDCLISIDVEDTTYSMPQETFDTLKNGIYYWVAAVCKDPDDNDIGVIAWGESWSFVIQKPEEQQGLDLDTTYFPFGLGYEWCYRRHNFGWDEDGGSWSNSSTFTIRIVDSSWIKDTMVFELEGGSFRDLGSPVKICNDEIKIFGGSYPEDVIELEPKEQDVQEGVIGILVKYHHDSLYMETGYDPSECDLTWYTLWADRIKGVGVIFQGHDRDEIHPDYHDFTTDRLLYFYNGQDTVWKAD